jgi:hypothetical protein
MATLRRSVPPTGAHLLSKAVDVGAFLGLSHGLVSEAEQVIGMRHARPFGLTGVVLPSAVATVWGRGGRCLGILSCPSPGWSSRNG